MTNEWHASLASHRQQQRNAIHRAAVELAVEHGVAGVSMIALARRAGISRATLYKYFPNVEAVLASYTVAEIEQELARLDRRLAELDDPLAQLRAMLVQLLGYFASPGHLSAASVIDPHHLSPAAGAEVGAAMARLHERVRRQVVAAAETGALRAEVDPDLLAEVFRHLLGAGRTLVVDHHRSPEDAAALVWQQFLHGAADTSAATHRRS